MAASRQEALRGAWLGGRAGTLTARDEARALALRESWNAEGKSSYGMLTHIASKLCTITPPRKKKEHLVYSVAFRSQLRSQVCRVLLVAFSVPSASLCFFSFSP